MFVADFDPPAPPKGRSNSKSDRRRSRSRARDRADAKWDRAHAAYQALRAETVHGFPGSYVRRIPSATGVNPLWPVARNPQMRTSILFPRALRVDVESEETGEVCTIALPVEIASLIKGVPTHRQVEFFDDAGVATEVHMGTYRHAMLRRRILEERVYGWVPGFSLPRDEKGEPMRHAPSPFGDERFRPFDPMPAFADHYGGSGIYGFAAHPYA